MQAAINKTFVLDKFILQKYQSNLYQNFKKSINFSTLRPNQIDILEIALAVSKRYGFQMRSDDPKNKESFASIRALSLYISQERTK